MELVGRMAAYAERRKEMMAPVANQVFEVIHESGALLFRAKDDEKKENLTHFINYYYFLL